MRTPGVEPKDFHVQCRGKRQYGSKRMANGICRVMRRNHPEDADILNVYRCPGCDYWHVGRSRRRKK